MTNYVDPSATRPVSLGPCRCPLVNGQAPHEADSANVVIRYGYGELGAIRRALRTQGVEAFKMAAIQLGVKSWNLVLPDGTPRPVDADQVARLDEATVTLFMGSDDVVGLLDEAFAEDPLPNASGGPSPAGSPESGSPIPTTPEPPSSTST
ncbi:MAG TPA: hypothetical protein VN773_07255 [Verrucomicrobiae bacterium]|nr:hypothetical protein [Verrucomicrobiae bacterium]